MISHLCNRNIKPSNVLSFIRKGGQFYTVDGKGSIKAFNLSEDLEERI